MIALVPVKPSDCFDWLSEKSAIHHLQLAYRAATRDCHPPKGEPFVLHGEPWSNGEDFINTLTQVFTLQLQAAAHQAGIAGFELACEKAPIKQVCSEQGYAFSSEAGQSPAAMAQGCAAVALGAGSAGVELEQSGNAKEVVT